MLGIKWHANNVRYEKQNISFWVKAVAIAKMQQRSTMFAKECLMDAITRLDHYKQQLKEEIGLCTE